MAELLMGLYKRQGFRRLLVIAIFILFLYLTRSLINLFLFTFIFTYIIYSAQNFLSSKINRIIPINPKIIICILYVAALFGLIFGIYKLSPVVVNETRQAYEQFMHFYRRHHNDYAVLNLINDYVNSDKIKQYFDQSFDFLFKSVTNISSLGLSIFLSIILSLFFLLELGQVKKFTSKFKRSKLSFIYEEMAYFGQKFVQSFGKVLETQFLIALINGVLSTIVLYFLHFPNVLALGVMIFILGLIPVAGVMISLIPLCLIAFSIGRMLYVLYVLIMIVALHSLESYLLNPKLMSAKTNLPVVYTFVILIVGEHFFGIWGLIVGIPIFMFILDIMDVNSKV